MSNINRKLNCDDEDDDDLVGFFDEYYDPTDDEKKKKEKEKQNKNMKITRLTSRQRKKARKWTIITSSEDMFCFTLRITERSPGIYKIRWGGGALHKDFFKDMLGFPYTFCLNNPEEPRIFKNLSCSIKDDSDGESEMELFLATSVNNGTDSQPDVLHNSELCFIPDETLVKEFIPLLGSHYHHANLLEKSQILEFGPKAKCGTEQVFRNFKSYIKIFAAIINLKHDDESQNSGDDEEKVIKATMWITFQTSGVSDTKRKRSSSDKRQRKKVKLASVENL